MKLLGWTASSRRAVAGRLQSLLPRPSRAAREREDAVGLLSEKDETAPFARPNCIHRKLGIVCALLAAFLLLLALGQPLRHLSGAGGTGALPAKTTPEETENHYIHLVSLATSSTSELCKTVLASTLLGYPPPAITMPDVRPENAGREIDAVLDRLKGTLAVLNGVKAQTDTAIILGNPRTWFQVRSEVLLERYLHIKHHDGERLLAAYGNHTLAAHGVAPRVVFASDKTCSSTVNLTDACSSVQLGDGSLRYLSHDLVMGQIVDLKPLYQLAIEEAAKLAHMDAAFNEHSIFGRILRDQERYRVSLGNLADWDSEAALPRKDFGIALDTESDLRYIESGTGSEARWVRHNVDSLGQENLPRDIALSGPPYWTVSANHGTKTWGDVALLVHEHKVPALVQRAPNADPALGQTWYAKLWFHPHARALLDSEAIVPSSRPATLIDLRTGHKQRYWTMPLHKIGVYSADGRFHHWKNVFSDDQVAHDVFLDSKGPWVDPRP